MENSFIYLHAPYNPSSINIPSPLDRMTIFLYNPSSIRTSSSCVPLSATRPPSMTAMQSAFLTVCSRCAMTIVVIFFLSLFVRHRLPPSTFSSSDSSAWSSPPSPPALCASNRSSASWTSPSDSESNADVASSNSRTSGSFATALAMTIRCRCPPLSCVPRSPTSVSYPSGKADTKSCALASLAARTISSCVAAGRPYDTLDRIVPENRTGSWVTMPTRRRWAFTSIRRRSRPSTRTHPERGS
mmetsp:Transcript_33805/g.100830  ORF Transcript_33805/g.100830 Transcript_33805/m.100830 type:complete len:243 (-) Transcript_33805:1910-2638(-)